MRVITVSAFLFFLILTFGTVSNAASSRGGYEINSYDCYYKVGSDNVYHVVETIDVNFLEPRHGIYREIPEVNHIERLDGSRDTIIAEVNVKSCSDTFTDYREGYDRVIKIGDKDAEITGQRTYTIIYDVHWGSDRVTGADEFYMNLIGDGWDVPVKNLTFTIEMPKEFRDTGDNIGFYYGAYKNSKIDGIQYSFDGKKIRGALTGYQIEPGAFFTTRILLEDGYFSQISDFPTDGLIAVVLCSLFLAVSLIIWMRIGHDREITEIVEFYPPDGLNCAEIAYAAYGRLSNRDCVPMIIGLAAKGYIEIIQNDPTGKEFAFRILRDYEGADESELIFMKGLAQYGPLVTKRELQNSFYKTLNQVNKAITKALEKKIFYKKTLLWRYITLPFAAIPYFVGMHGVMSLHSGDGVMSTFILIALFLLMTTMTICLVGKRVRVFVRIMAALMIVTVIMIFIWFLMDPIRYSGPFYWVVFAACILANIGQILFMHIIDKRTDYGIDLLGRIRGFRRYLMTAVRPHLVSLVQQDPQYFYKILPYTYVLGVTSVWVDQFESIAMAPPHWYHGVYGSRFHYHDFNRFMNNTMTSAQSVMTSSPSSSGSGGGFSGGGGGGGGGGSW